jgi:hypothetical protein
MTHAFVCGPGCCPGCQDCYGMSIGCHQQPCRCELPCICGWRQEDAINPACERHDSKTDARFGGPDEDYEDGPGDGELRVTACPECGETGQCAVDDLGRPLIHALTEPEDQS